VECLVKFVAVVVLVLMGVSLAVPASATPGPPGHGEWWFDTWNVPQLWSEGARGQGVVIGEIDTGVNANLPALSGNVLRGTDFGSAGGDGRIDRDSDLFGHGTGMASLMVGHAGQDNILGMAPDAKILPVAVPITGTTDDAGGEANGDLLQAIRWAADHGARIISMSLGAPRDANGATRSCPAAEQDAVDYALGKGAIVVASSGNEGDRGSPIEEPSVCLGVISVGAVDSSGVVPKWSSRHPYLTVTAPGVNVPTVGRIPGEAFYGDGTSQAAAITSAGLAVIWSKYPKLTAAQVVARLLATLDGRRAIRDAAKGYGSINIGSAVRSQVPADAPDPVYAAVAPFMARDKASAAAPSPAPEVPPVGHKAPLPGGYAVRAAPGPLASGRGLAGVVGAAVGLLAAILLIGLALGRRRSRRTAIGSAPDTTLSPGESTAPAADSTPGEAESTSQVAGSPTGGVESSSGEAGSCSAVVGSLAGSVESTSGGAESDSPMVESSPRTVGWAAVAPAGESSSGEDGSPAPVAELSAHHSESVPPRGQLSAPAGESRFSGG
jgi:subtilisin family serine protease